MTRRTIRCFVCPFGRRGDGAAGVLRARAPESGELVHDFTDPDWTTRFLGDLYQDLSDDARKRYALLQTPEFVEDWILDRARSTRRSASSVTSRCE